MKKNAIITIDSTTAQVTKAFYKQARIFGTPEYETWKAYRQDFPNATMETKSIKKNPNKKSYKNLTYANIESYLKVQPNGAELLKEFEEKKATTRIEKNPYHEGSPRTRTTTKYRSEQCKRAATDIPSVAALLYYKS